MTPGLPRAKAPSKTPSKAKDKTSKRVGTQDRRDHARCTFHTEMHYRVADSGNSVWGNGRTLDMSAGGVRLEIAEPIPAGTVLEILLEWTRLYHDSEQVRFWARAQVVRSVPGETAARILRHEFRTFGAPLAAHWKRPKVA